ncbi:unnamed protein product [Acanthoscelides obtectus]|uniref:Uncharacterized protein n=1 Tax=Acanthoscelides obtectus TaxID=200917 RepID=A0A9P0PM57_ACAOB|nr:unnamed protein product [Acanthoscelides obtectus]CAK1638314.1 hypothetical protein AOBTE_LOCUS10527 [Acanthoscelides obtectus]
MRIVSCFRYERLFGLQLDIDHITGHRIYSVRPATRDLHSTHPVLHHLCGRSTRKWYIGHHFSSAQSHEERS